jgi:hypothetical protein
MVLLELEFISNEYASNQNYPKSFVEISYINWQQGAWNGFMAYIKSLFMVQCKVDFVVDQSQQLLVEAYHIDFENNVYDGLWDTRNNVT